MVKHSAISKLEYNKITKYITIGTNMCCQTHFDNSLKKKGIKVDISLEGERVDAPFGLDLFLWLPTKDHTGPSQIQLRVGVEFLHDVISLKLPIYVHCQNGHGRAPTLVAAYLISKGMGVKEAVAYIKKKRKTIHPNKKQLAALTRFAKSLNRKK